MSEKKSGEKVDAGIDLKKYLKDIFGFNGFKGNQEAVIRNVLAGEDTFVIMPTGGGKSLCYQLPAIIMDGVAIVVSPLISLMKNQVDAIRNRGTSAGVAHVFNSTLTKTQAREVISDLQSGVTKLLYVAPESLAKEENIEMLKELNISFFAIDEAHCISEWGHDFRPEYRRLRTIIEEINENVPILALTATATPKVQQDIMKTLGMQDAKVFISSFNRPNLYYEIRPKSKDVMQLHKEIVKFILENEGKSGIIYCFSRKKVEELAELLLVNNIKAVPYHAGLDTNTRAANQDKFLMEDVQVVVATIAFGMGIDKPDVRYVIHYDMPKSLEGYYQETGRGGRDDGEGKCLAFYDIEDISKLEKFLKDKPVSEREVALQLMEETISYAESSVCRRINLLNYFGEKYEQKECGNCDNCLNPKPKIAVKDEMVLVLETVLAVKQLFKVQHIVQIITGITTGPIKVFKHNKLSQFGEGKDQDNLFWNAVVRQAIIEGLLHKEIESYGLLKITPEGQKYLKRPYEIMVPKDHDYTKDSDDVDVIETGGKSVSGVLDERLFKDLKDLLKKIAKQEKLPPYVIFEERSLEDMTIQYPVTLDEMKTIVGVGANKAQKYGQPFVDLIKKHVEENEIERPQDIVMKSVVNKSGLKVYIIQSIDKKLALEDIAQAKNLTIEELLTEMEHIVRSGTRLNVDYYVQEYIDPAHEEEIWDYLLESETDSVEDALVELGENEFSEEEIRIMRIKFFSKYGQ
ncbi:DNA helicase RecQ [Bacteroidales bacterium OttesenSCG-928-C19]|nr:DNA helicase RecQ [Bacteroidales bacterium OttesenSCG-928-C19]